MTIPSFNNRRFAVSAYAESEPPIKRYAKEGLRGPETEWARLEMPEPWVKVIGGLIGWVVFAVTGFWLAGVMAKVMHG